MFSINLPMVKLLGPEPPEPSFLSFAPTPAIGFVAGIAPF